MRLRGARGNSVLELAVTIGLLSVVAIPMLSFMRTANSRQHEVTTSTTAVSHGRLAVARIQRDVRQARTIVAGATPNEVIVWCDRDRDAVHDVGEDVTYAIVGARVVRDDGLAPAIVLDGLASASTLRLLPTPTGHSVEIHLVLDVGPRRQPIVLHTEVVPRAA